MKEEEIKIGNELIAKFLDWKEKWPDDDYIAYYLPKFWAGEFCITQDFDSLEPFQMLFHSSWDWLMPVIEKIDTIEDSLNGKFGVYISSNRCTIQSTKLFMSDSNKRYYSQTYADTKFEATYKVVVKFIKWYNKYKENE